MTDAGPLGIPGEWTGGMLSFGAPESVLDPQMLFDMFQVYRNGRWFEPPVSMVGLGRAYRMAPYHQSSILLKRNLLAQSFKPHKLLSKRTFKTWALDYLIFGNCYLQEARNVFDAPLQLLHSPAAWTRVGLEPDEFWYIEPAQFLPQVQYLIMGDVVHLKEPDPLQEIYGMPEYLSSIQSGLLNENATLFRRKYYLNGMHAGFILYISEENFSEIDRKNLTEQMKRAKGPGNFRNLLLHVPKGKPEGVKVIPISEIAAKDEFMHIKEVTRDDMLSAHRVPPQLLGIVPKNGTGFGNVIDAARAFYHLEIVPLQAALAELNEEIGDDVVTFEEPLDVALLDPANPSVKG
jgi:PBSX family phage portal protein